MIEPRRPQRKCIACGMIKDKEKLLRIVMQPGDNVVPDPGGRLPGRGAYLCIKRECIERAVSKRCLDRTFRRKVSEESYRALSDINIIEGSYKD